MAKISGELNRLLDKVGMPTFDWQPNNHNESTPVTTLYTDTLNLMSALANELQVMPPLGQFHDFLSKWQNLYQPSYPPMSPITMSYFSCWNFFDVRYGADKETIGSCLISVASRLNLSPLQRQAMANLSTSRMGLYEVTQGMGSLIWLREMLTQKPFSAHFPTGYAPAVGDIVWVRLLPSLIDGPTYHVAITTPYRIHPCTASDWLNYFNRHQLSPNTQKLEERLHDHMKYGLNSTFWSEYAFYGYQTHTSGMIELTGFPDQSHTQPHHADFKVPTGFVSKRTMNSKATSKSAAKKAGMSSGQNPFEPLTDEELDQLEEYLTFECESDDCMIMDFMDGFLHAIAIGPSTIMPQEWLPKVWGHESMMPPVESLEDMNRLVSLVMRHYNSIISKLEAKEAVVTPVWTTESYRGKEYPNAEAWSVGFMEGVGLRHADWQPLLLSDLGAAWHRPIEILGHEIVGPEVYELTKTPARRAKLALEIPQAVANMYSYWLPLRQAVFERKVAKTMQTKVGRNDPCPCGSTIKFKKCCGAAANLH